MVWEDGTSFVGYSAFRVVDQETGRQEFAQANVDRTHAQIARFSQRDADTYLDLLEEYSHHWKNLLLFLQPALRLRHRPRQQSQLL